jgi:hypothetical protein
VDPNDIISYYVLKDQARAIIELYSNLMKEFDANVHLWNEDQAGAAFSSDSGLFCSGKGYESLKRMKYSIIPLIMNEYSQDQHGWWHELLCEIVNGKPSNSQKFDKANLYSDWAVWFERGGNPPHVSK